MFLPLTQDFVSESLFHDLFSENSLAAYPQLDIKEDESKYTVLVDLPGVSKDAVSIDLVNSRLELSVSEKAENDESKYLLRERKTRNIKRLIYLGKDANRDSITAKLENGVLTIEVFKDKPETKRIEIK